MTIESVKALEIDTDTIFEVCKSGTLADMLESAEMILECHRVLAKTGQSIVSETLRFTDHFVEWKHVPEKDVHDTASHSQFYYHAHPKSDQKNQIHDDEHGHFHLFMRKKGMIEGIIPANIPDFDPQTPEKDIISHIIGIGMDKKGMPIKLFTTNRWVTGETWFHADDVLKMVPHFEIDHAWPSWPLNLWITHMVRLFTPQIRALLTARDNTISRWQENHPQREKTVYEDRDLEITSWCPINIEKQILSVQEAQNRIENTV